MSRTFVIAIVGAESTGKTALAQALHQAFASQGRRSHCVPEYLREFCDARGRTPMQHEQIDIAEAQTSRIAGAADVVTPEGIVVADTTALMTAVYSDQVFGDTSLYEQALHAHARADLTLLTALDLPWQPDGVQRDGPQVRVPVDEKLRAALVGAGLAFAVVAGRGAARLQAAQAAVEAARRRQVADAGASRWRHVCGRCGDADCERHLFGRLG
jgi:nicotinamide riboside kinase